jgi:chaperonin GroES
LAKDSLARGAKSATFSVPHSYPDTAEPKSGVPDEPLEGTTLEVKQPVVVDRRPQYGQEIADHYAAKALEPEPVCPTIKAVPLGSKVIVWRIPVRTGPIVVAEIGQEKPLEAQVVAVSAVGLNEHDTKALSLLSVGDRVLVRKHSGTEVKVEGHEVTVLHVADILARL